MCGLEGTGEDLDSDLVGRILACILVPACLKAVTGGWVTSAASHSWGTVACEQRSILTWWPPASTEGLFAGETGVSCWGWQYLWASLVKFSDSVPLGITELMNLTSSGGSESTVFVSWSPLEMGPRESWEREECPWHGGRRDVGGRELLGWG